MATQQEKKPLKNALSNIGKALVKCLIDWLRLDLIVTPAMMHSLNPGDLDHRRAWEWTPERLAALHRAAERVGARWLLIN